MVKSSINVRVLSSFSTGLLVILNRRVLSADANVVGKYFIDLLLGYAFFAQIERDILQWTEDYIVEQVRADGRFVDPKLSKARSQFGIVEIGNGKVRNLCIFKSEQVFVDKEYEFASAFGKEIALQAEEKIRRARFRQISELLPCHPNKKPCQESGRGYPEYRRIRPSLIPKRA